MSVNYDHLLGPYFTYAEKKNQIYVSAYVVF